jgi:outer membrane lipoprotein-sorting protein
VTRSSLATQALVLGCALALVPAAARAQSDAKSRAPSAAAAQPAKDPGSAGAALPTWYALTLAHSEIGMNVAYFWSKGPKMRAETVVAGRKIVSIVNGDTYTAFDATGREGVAIGRAPEAIAKDAPGRRPFGREVEVIVGQGGEKVGEEEIGGRLCERYRVTDGAGRREVWVTKDELRLPVRLEIYTRLSGKTIHTDFVNWAAEIPIADGFFEPDPDLRLARLAFQEFADRQFTPVGPVPILYMDLLTGR